jgi:2-polyprenyl-3-methyl-5-hydroxy-6-metoxy-1,4-benzoquinol methylase
MIEIAKKQHDTAAPEIFNRKFECAGIDSYTKKSASSSYDIVLGLSILHVLPNKDDALRRVHGLIQPGGYFISSATCLRDFVQGFFRYIAVPFFLR